MYPYCGHLALGLAGIAMFPESAPLQFAWFVGSLVPDTPATIQSVADRLRGKPELEEQSKSFLRIQEIVNSFPLLAATAILIWVTYSWTIWVVLWSGYYFHVFYDLYTHSGKEYQATDPSYLWPFNILFPGMKLGSVLGLCEYRNGIGLKMPKIGELIFSVVLIVAALVARIYGINFQWIFFLLPVAIAMLPFTLLPILPFLMAIALVYAGFRDDWERYGTPWARWKEYLRKDIIPRLKIWRAKLF